VTGTLDVDHTRARKPPTAAKQSNATIGEPALLVGVGVIGDHEVAPGERGGDVNFGLSRSLKGAMHGLARAQQCLRRNACPIGTLAANEFALYECDAQATFYERTDAVFARRTTADDDYVEVVH
jgi:hypothetical protein